MLSTKGYEFQALDNVIKIYFDNGDEIKIVLGDLIIMHKYSNGATTKHTYVSDVNFLEDFQKL